MKLIKIHNKSIILGGTPGHQNPLRGFQTPCPLPPFGELQFLTFSIIRFFDGKLL
jgi:hypothetical protein